MAFRLVQSGGAVTDPAVVNLYASGTIWNGCVVSMAMGAAGIPGYVYAAATITPTAIFGIAQGYVEGASDTMVKVIPFTQGQVWEADCTSNTTTAHVQKRHALTDSLTVANTGYDLTSLTGIFLAYNLTGATGDKKILGTFLKQPYADRPA